MSFCYREGRVEQQGASEAGNMQLQVNFPQVAFRRFMKMYSKLVRIIDVPTDVEFDMGKDLLEVEEEDS